MIRFDAFISDPHFGHKNIIKYCNRPFSSKEEQTEVLIKNYNEKVGPNDTCLWLGDCFFGSNRFAKEIMGRLNGRKILVRGNHDPTNPFDCVARGFDFVTDRMYVRWEGKDVILSHYDQLDLRSPWDDRYEDRRVGLNKNKMTVVIHGHTHQKTKTFINQIHVGVDSWDYAPARYEEIAPLIRALPDNWNKEMEKQYQALVEYRSIIRTTVEDKDRRKELLSDPRFDEFRILGWEVETENRRL